MPRGIGRKVGPVYLSALPLLSSVQVAVSPLTIPFWQTLWCRERF